MKRQRKSDRTKLNLILDIVLTGSFLALLKPFTTGITVHEWLGLAIGVGVLVHMALHWRWIVGITQKLFGKLPLKTVVNYCIDGVLLAGFAAITLSGLLMSQAVLPLFGLVGSPSALLSLFHKVASYGTLAVLGLKVALHWAWIVRAVKRHILGIGAPRTQPQPGLTGAVVTATIGESAAGATGSGVAGGIDLSRRRALLTVGSALSLAFLGYVLVRAGDESGGTAGDDGVLAEADSALLASDAAAGVLLLERDDDDGEIDDDEGAAPSAVQSQATATADTSATATPAPTSTPAASAVPSTARGRTRCPYGLVDDPYPGRCHRYRDSNGNGLCDLSESV